MTRNAKFKVKPEVTVTVFYDKTAKEADGRWKVILKTKSVVRIIQGHSEAEVKRKAGIAP